MTEEIDNHFEKELRAGARLNQDFYFKGETNKFPKKVNPDAYNNYI